MPDAAELAATARKDLRSFKSDQKEKAKTTMHIPDYIKAAFAVSPIQAKHVLTGAGIGAGLGGLRSLTQDPEHRHTGANILGGAALGAAGGAGYSALRGHLPQAIGGEKTPGEMMAPAGQTIEGAVPVASRAAAHGENAARRNANAFNTEVGAPLISRTILPVGFAPSMDGKWLIHEETGSALHNKALSPEDVAEYHKGAEAKVVFWATEYAKLAGI